MREIIKVETLKDIDIFNNVKIKYGTISWGNNIDMCADSLYETSKTIEK